MARVDRENTAHFWHDPRIPGLSLMCADFKTQEYAPHQHDAFVVAVTESGGSMIKSRGVVARADAPTLLVLNPVEAQSSWMGRSRRCFRWSRSRRPAGSGVGYGCRRRSNGGWRARRCAFESIRRELHRLYDSR